MRLLRLLYVELVVPRAKLPPCCCCWWCWPPGAPSPVSPFMSDATLAAVALTLLSYYCTTFCLLPPLPLSQSGVILFNPAAGHVLQSAAVGGPPTSAEHAARWCRPAAADDQLIRLHHQLFRSLGWVWPAACICKRSCCSTCAGCPLPSSVSVGLLLVRLCAVWWDRQQ